MPHLPRKLTAATIQTVTEPGTYKIRPNLYIRVTRMKQGGICKQWINRIHVGNGKRVQKGLGSFPKVGVREAERRAEEQRVAIRNGELPAAPALSKVKPDAPTFGELENRIFENSLAAWSDKSVTQWNTIARAIPDWLRDMALTDITTDHIVDVLNQKSEKKGEAGTMWTQYPAKAKAVRKQLKRIMEDALLNGHISLNPVNAKLDTTSRLGKQSHVVRHHSALPVADMPEFYRRLEALDMNPVAKAVMLFIALTGARKTEALELKWSELDDMDNGVWRLPAKRSKTKKLHQIMLSNQAIGVLRSMAAIRESEYVFPGQWRGKQAKPISDRPLDRIREAIGMEGVQRHGNNEETRKLFDLHGFRTSFSAWTRTALPVGGDSRTLAEIQLSHAIGNEVERSYTDNDVPERRRELVQAWADYVTASGTG